MTHQMNNAEVAKNLELLADLLEIDGDPARLDLRDSHARAAIDAGCTLSVDSDAHSTGA